MQDGDQLFSVSAEGRMSGKDAPNYSRRRQTGRCVAGNNRDRPGRGWPLSLEGIGQSG